YLPIWGVGGTPSLSQCGGLRTSEAPMTESASFTQLQDLSAAFARLVGIAAPGIVVVQSHRSRSSGFFWRPGLIVTADEALSEEGDVAVTLPGGESIGARLVGRDHTTDIRSLLRALGPDSVGQTVTLGLRRGGE